MGLKTVNGAAAGPHKGRGAPANPEGRFERLQRRPEDDGWEQPAQEETGRLLLKNYLLLMLAKKLVT